MNGEELMRTMACPGAEALYDSDWENDAKILDAAIAEAVAAERERCAKIAEEPPPATGIRIPTQFRELLMHLFAHKASRIRSTK